MRSAVTARCNILFLGMLYVSIPPVVYHEYDMGNGDILYRGWLMADHEAWTPKFLPERRASFTYAHLLGRLENKHEAMFSIKYDMTLARSRFATNLRFDFEHRISFALCRGTWGGFPRIRFCRGVGNSHFVRTFLAILRVCLAQSQHTIDMPNKGAKTRRWILSCNFGVPVPGAAFSPSTLSRIVRRQTLAIGECS